MNAFFQPKFVSITDCQETKMVHKVDEIVVTGVSCRLPESDNIEEFKENLMKKLDMITEDDRRWTPGKLKQVKFIKA